MKNTLYLLSSCLLFTSAGEAGAQGYVWLKGGGSVEEDQGLATTLDQFGNVYVTGQCTGTTDFGGTNLVSVGDSDAFLAKFAPDGSLIWVRQAGGPSTDAGRGICISSSGDVYVTGSFTTEAAFGNTNLNAAGVNIFVAKYDASGNLLRAQWVGAGYGFGVAAGADDSCYVTGRNFGIYIAKFDPAGEQVWSKKLGNANFTQGSGIAVDSNANVYVTGAYYGPLPFDGANPAGNGASRGPSDIFLVKYDSFGAFQWLQTAGGNNIDAASGLAIDANANIYITGAFVYTADFGSTNISTLFYSGSNPDIFAAKYSSSGILQWVSRLGGGGGGLDGGADEGRAIAVDTNGNVFVTGYLGPAFYLAKLDRNGNRLWLLDRPFGAGFGVAASPRGEVFVTGRVAGNSYFDFLNLTNVAAGIDGNFFVAKLFDEIPPVVLTSPSPITLRPRESATMALSVRSWIPVFYQWKLGGMEIPGATGATLVLSNVTTADAGVYAVEAYNQFGTSSVSAAVSILPRTITGQWDFDRDLSATIGSPLAYRGDTATIVSFTNAVINGATAGVMQFPAFPTNNGIIMPHGAAPNQGLRVNQWTLIMDVSFANPSNLTYSSVLQTDPSNVDGADVFVRWVNGSGCIGALSFTAPLIKTNTWYRVVIGVNASAGILSRYVNGLKQTDERLVREPDGALALLPTALLFCDNAGRTIPGFVNSIQMRDYKVFDDEAALLGGASASGIPLLRMSMPSGNANAQISIARLDDIPFTNAVPNLKVYASTNLTEWSLVSQPLISSNGTLLLQQTNDFVSQRFYKVVRE